MADQIIICDLAVDYCVGVSEEERAQKQRLLFSIEMGLDLTRAAANDDIWLSVDYDALIQRLKGFGEERSWKLIETLAVDIAEMILHDFRPARVDVVIKKTVFKDARFVAVRISRP
jgi:7,8-dihydroneopterin aldolase/epimerase/oxygenase